ncbi:hypothetical protein HMPREF9057_02569 [Actinomyces sp. oral taxon 171 str. F0337]|nr:hypothetical protein HMPREF9057_02569 [Actinomyces sp. oral taxon 171 str. F0337]
MVVPFAGPGGPSDGREERLDSAGADDVADRFQAAQRAYPAGDRLSGGSPAG